MDENKDMNKVLELLKKICILQQVCLIIIVIFVALMILPLIDWYDVVFFGFNTP